MPRTYLDSMPLARSPNSNVRCAGAAACERRRGSPRRYCWRATPCKACTEDWARGSKRWTGRWVGQEGVGLAGRQEGQEKGGAC